MNVVHLVAECVEKRYAIAWMVEEYVRPPRKEVYIYSDEILPRLSVGDEDALGERFFTHVLSIRESGVEIVVPHTVQQHQRIVAEDNEEENLYGHFDLATLWIWQAWQSSQDALVLVHCHGGYSRSPTIFAAFLSQVYGISDKHALEWIGRHRTVDPNPGFRAQLASYSQRFCPVYQRRFSWLDRNERQQAKDAQRFWIHTVDQSCGHGFPSPLLDLIHDYAIVQHRWGACNISDVGYFQPNDQRIRVSTVFPSPTNHESWDHWNQILLHHSFLPGDHVVLAVDRPHHLSRYITSHFGSFRFRVLTAGFQVLDVNFVTDGATASVSGTMATISKHHPFRWAAWEGLEFYYDDVTLQLGISWVFRSEQSLQSIVIGHHNPMYGRSDWQRQAIYRRPLQLALEFCPRSQSSSMPIGWSFTCRSYLVPRVRCWTFALRLVPADQNVAIDTLVCGPLRVDFDRLELVLEYLMNALRCSRPDVRLLHPLRLDQLNPYELSDRIFLDLTVQMISDK